MTETLQEMLIRHEGLRLFPYRCSEGYLTIGVGRNLESKGISEDEAKQMLSNDLKEVTKDLLDIFGGDAPLSEARSKALCDMRFQLGASGFRSFSSMIQAVKDQDWDRAADEALNSLWAQQTPERAQEIAEMLRNG